MGLLVATVTGLKFASNASAAPVPLAFWVNRAGESLLRYSISNGVLVPAGVATTTGTVQLSWTSNGMMTLIWPGEMNVSGAAIPPIVTETPSSSVGSGTLAADVVADARLLPKIAANVPGARLPLYEMPFSTPCTTGNVRPVWKGCIGAPLKVCAQADPVV